uniref:Uncharacterized protein n=1 Tax=viral metagenome TaxID=1070528 RepID=A0A6M3K912_9ZZZZ
MDATTQRDSAAAFERTGYHFYRGDSDSSGNLRRLDKLDWSAALVLIQRHTGWILAKDAAEPDPRQLVLVPDDAPIHQPPRGTPE